MFKRCAHASVSMHLQSRESIFIRVQWLNYPQYVSGDLKSIHHALSPSPCLFSGCLLAVLSGLMYGSSFAPILYIKTHSSCHDSMFHGASVYGMVSVFVTAIISSWTSLKVKMEQTLQHPFRFKTAPHCWNNTGSSRE